MGVGSWVMGEGGSETKAWQGAEKPIIVRLSETET